MKSKSKTFKVIKFAGLTLGGGKGRKTSLSVLEYFVKEKKIPQAPYSVAKTDLNNDAIEEYILRPLNKSDCPKAPICPHYIVAQQNHEYILLGKFDAHKMLISNKKAYGIRDIIVYNTPHNDFSYKTAVWNPFSYRFELP